MKELKNIQAFYFLLSTIIGGTLYVHTTFATTSSVSKIDEKISNLHNLLCVMAIEQHLSRSQEICRRM